jgi:hypothetical protein
VHSVLPRILRQCEETGTTTAHASSERAQVEGRTCTKAARRNDREVADRNRKGNGTRGSPATIVAEPARVDRIVLPRQQDRSYVVVDAEASDAIGDAGDVVQYDRARNSSVGATSTVSVSWKVTRTAATLPALFRSGRKVISMRA